MKIVRPALRTVLAAAACTLIAACADKPPQQTELDYRSRAPSTGQGKSDTPGSSDQRLTIQSGEGERLNLPWFVRDAQDWINSN
jgi:type IV pilus biogenesis protein CpaD/CtpE